QMGSGTARSPLNVTDFVNFDLQNLTGMFFDPEAGRLYFNTPQSSSGGGTSVRLSYRQFSTESNIVGAARYNGPPNIAAQGSSPGITWTNVRSMFLTGGHLYIADTTGNLTRWDWQSNANTSQSGTPVPGTGVVVSGPAIDGEDWRARDAFVFVGEGEVAPNQPPVANATVSCTEGDCT